MRKSYLGLALGLIIGGMAASETGGQTPAPPNGCAPDVTVDINESMPSVPNLTVSAQHAQFAWASPTQFTIAFAPQTGGKNPYPNSTCTSTSPFVCYSCALSATATSPVDYTITFTISQKKIYGHIIITKPIGKK